MRVLVTGGAGFVGSHVVEALAHGGHEPLVLDAMLPAAHGPDAQPQLPAGVPFTRADVRDLDTVEAALHGVDAVCHQAAMVGLGKEIADLPDYVSCNDQGTAVLLAAMARANVRRLVLASSMVVYGEGRYECGEHGVVAPPPRAEADLAAGRFDPACPVCGRSLGVATVPEQAPLDPRNVYAATKAAQEHLVRSWARETGSAAVALRYHNVYGPRMPRDTPYSGVAALFRSALEAGQPPLVFEDGAQRRDFVHVTDVALANMLALLSISGSGPGSSGGVFRAYNVASGVPCTIGDVARVLASACGGPEPVVTGGYRLGDVRHIVADPGRAARELGFRARIAWTTGMPGFASDPLRAAAALPR